MEKKRYPAEAHVESLTAEGLGPNGAEGRRLTSEQEGEGWSFRDRKG